MFLDDLADLLDRRGFDAAFDAVDIDMWLLVIPQIIARIHTPVPTIRKSVHDLLDRVAKAQVGFITFLVAPLFQALQLLDQAPPPALVDESPEAQLRWAIENWSVSRLAPLAHRPTPPEQ